MYTCTHVMAKGCGSPYCSYIPSLFLRDNTSDECTLAWNSKHSLPAMRTPTFPCGNQLTITTPETIIMSPGIPPVCHNVLSCAPATEYACHTAYLCEIRPTIFYNVGRSWRQLLRTRYSNCTFWPINTTAAVTQENFHPHAFHPQRHTIMFLKY